MADSQIDSVRDKIERGRRLASLRVHLGYLKLTDFARALGMQQGSLRDVEIGRNNLSADLMAKLADTYQVNLTWLFTGRGEMIMNTDFYTGGEPTAEQAETLYHYVLENKGIKLSATNDLKFRMACLRALKDNPNLGSLYNYGIAGEVYLNLILSFPELTL